MTFEEAKYLLEHEREHLTPSQVIEIGYGRRGEGKDQWTQEEKDMISSLIKRDYRDPKENLVMPVIRIVEMVCLQRGQAIPKFIFSDKPPLTTHGADTGPSVSDVSVVHLKKDELSIFSHTRKDMLRIFDDAETGVLNILVVTDVSNDLLLLLSSADTRSYTAVDIFEDGESGMIGFYFKKEFYSYDVALNVSVGMYYYDGKDIDEQKIEYRYVMGGGCRPKFYCLAGKRANEVWEKAGALSAKSGPEGGADDYSQKNPILELPSLMNMRYFMESYVRVWQGQEDSGSGYFYIDWSEPGDPDKSLGGDTMMKSCLKTSDAPLPHGQYMVASSPSIIIDTDRKSVMEFRYRKNDYRAHAEKRPLLMDPHFLCYKLNEIDSDGTPNPIDDHNIYKDAANKINKRFKEWCDFLEGKMSAVRGIQYHMSIDEEMYLLDKFAQEIMYDRRHVRNQVDRNAGVVLSPCGFDISDYLEELQRSKLVKFQKTGDGSTGYCHLDKASMSDIMLFSFIINSKIAESYDGATEKSPEWDAPLFQSNGGMVHKKWRDCRNKKEYRYNDNSYDINDTRHKLVVNEIKQMRTAYFAALFDVDSSSLVSLKSTAIDEKSANDGNRQLVIRCINEIDIRKGTDTRDGQ